LIAGGAEKNLSFEKLAKVIVKKVKNLVLLEGEATSRLLKSVDNNFLRTGKSIPVEKAESMKKAVKMAFRFAKEGDVVLLSPACASFGMFKHEFDRGEQFNKAVKDLIKDC